jgi:hypothetical protein
LIEHKISDLYKKGKISFQQLQVFCTQLMRTNQLKLFPTLITYKKIYKTAEEEDYYHSQALLDTLIDFCEYAKLRIDSEIRSMVLPAGKSAALQKMIEELKKLQQEEFLGDYTGMDMTNYFSDPILRLEKILSMPRVTLYAGKSTTANTEWKAFYQDNEEILLKTARASNRLQHVF